MKKKISQTLLFAFLYFLAMAVATFLNHFVDRTGAMYYAPAFTAILGSIVYFYFAPKIQGFGAITFVGLFIGSFFLLTGHMYLAFLPGLLAGLLADAIAWRGHYRQKLYNQLSMLVFAFASTGPIFLMWLARDAYIDALIKRGKDSDYINKVLLAADFATISQFVLTVLVAGLLAALLGQFLYEHYFAEEIEKA